MVTEDRIAHTYSSLWSLPLLCVGLTVIAVCALLPQVETNQKLKLEREKLTADLGYVKSQVKVNDEFLRRVGGDAALAERLAQRQMKQIREGSAVLPLEGAAAHVEMSPFGLMGLTAPPPKTPYRIPEGLLGELCRHPKGQLYLIGLGLFLIAAALVAGDSAVRQSRPINGSLS